MSQKTFLEKCRECDKKYLLFLLAVSAVLMTFGSMTSFLFPMHVGVDQNCFFTIGKSVLDGKVLYKDIYDQKGPLLFFIHTLGAVISSENFLGVYVLQIINFFVILLYAGKTAKLYLGEKYRYLIPAVTGLIIVTSFCYSRGDNAEEFCMAFYMISIYHLFRFLKSEDKMPSKKLMFANGIFAACVLWIKYTMLGFYIGWCLAIGIAILMRKDFLGAIKAALLFVCGMLIGTAPYFIYAFATDSVNDFLWAYFYTNICMYSNKISFAKRVNQFFTQDILWNPILMTTILLGLFYFMRSKEMFKSNWEKASLILLVVFTYIFVFIGGTRYKYYLQIIGAFTVFGVIFWVRALETTIDKLMKKKKLTITIAVVIYMATLIGFSNCASYYFKSAEYYPQYQIAQIVKEDEGSTILNYNFLDAGIYLMSGSELPPTKYFCRQNITRDRLPELYDEPENLIRTKAVDYVVVRYGRGRTLDEFAECEELETNYTLIETLYEGVDDYYFALYKVNE